MFLQNVRQRAEDQKWEKRGGENELLKLEWWRLNRELQQAKESDIEGFVRVEEIEDEPPLDLQREPEMVDIDSMMLDAMEQEEQAEIDALLASLPSETRTSHSRPESMHFDDEDYDSIFMELLSAQQNNQLTAALDDVEMS